MTTIDSDVIFYAADISCRNICYKATILKIIETTCQCLWIGRLVSRLKVTRPLHLACSGNQASIHIKSEDCVSELVFGARVWNCLNQIRNGVDWNFENTCGEKKPSCCNFKLLLMLICIEYFFANSLSIQFVSPYITQ